MTNNPHRLIAKVNDKIKECLRNGQPVEATHFYHEVSLASLNDSKRLIDAIQSGQTAEVDNESLRAFLALLEPLDFVGAAASLCVHHRLYPADAIATTIRIANLLDVDMSSLDPSIRDNASGTSPFVQQLVNERAIQLSREKTIHTFMKHTGASPDVAAEVVAQLLRDNAQPAQHEPLLSPQPSTPTTSPLPQSDAPGSVPLATAQQSNSPTKRQIILRRVGRLAAIVYALLALLGLAGLGYSYVSSPTELHAFSLPENVPLNEQAAPMRDWANQNLPPTLTWFFPQDRYMSLRLEPGLPSDYAYLDLPWEEKIANLNKSAEATIAAFHNCQWFLLTCYGMALALAAWRYLESSLVAGIVMSLVGVMGVPHLTAGFTQLDLQNGIWLAPFLLPGIVATVVSIADMCLFPPETDRAAELKGFWVGLFAFAVGCTVLGIAITSGSRLRASAGLTVFGGLMLMIRHGWRYLRSFKSTPKDNSPK